jgi:hypothetical protein
LSSRPGRKSLRIFFPWFQRDTTPKCTRLKPALAVEAKVNRLNFIKTLGLLFFVPYVPGGKMTKPLSELLMSVIDSLAANQPVSQVDRENLKMALRDVDNSRFTTGNWTAPDGQVKGEAIDFPVTLLYQTELAEDTASIDVNLPQNFNHLLIFASGATTDPSLAFLWCQFNGDTGANYQIQWESIDNTSVTAGQDLAGVKAELGIFSTSGGTPESGSVVIFIPNYRSSVWYKNTISMSYSAKSNTLMYFGNSWLNAAPVDRITLLPSATTNLRAGTVFSIYALK